MAAHAFRQFMRNARAGLEELDEHERKKNEQKENARTHNNDRKDSSGVACEGNIAEAYRRHRGNGPVDSGNDAVLLAFGAHKGMERERIEYEHNDQRNENSEKEHRIAPARNPLE
jgi:hypothetical protein